jgi:hypothetical protein
VAVLLALQLAAVWAMAVVETNAARLRRAVFMRGFRMGTGFGRAARRILTSAAPAMEGTACRQRNTRAGINHHEDITP